MSDQPTDLDRLIQELADRGVEVADPRAALIAAKGGLIRPKPKQAEPHGIQTTICSITAATLTGTSEVRASPPS